MALQQHSIPLVQEVAKLCASAFKHQTNRQTEMWRMTTCLQAAILNTCVGSLTTRP